MDNTLDILNEILGTLGQVKNLMEYNAPQGPEPVDIQKTAINQIEAGNTSELGSLLGSLNKYISEYDESKAEIALLGFDYFIDAMNKASLFNASALANTENLALAFNYLLDSLTMSQSLDLEFAENVNKISATFINLLESLNELSIFDDETIDKLETFSISFEYIMETLSKANAIDEASLNNIKLSSESIKEFISILNGLGDLNVEVLNSLINNKDVLETYIKFINDNEWKKLSENLASITPETINGLSLFNEMLDSISKIKEVSEKDVVDFANTSRMLDGYINIIINLDWKRLCTAFSNIPDNANEGAKAFNNIIGSISGILNSMKNINNISATDKIRFKYFASKKFFDMLSIYIKGMVDVMNEINIAEKDGKLPNEKVTKAFVDSSEHLLGIIKSLKVINLVDIISFKMFGWLAFSAMRQYIRGMTKTLDLMTGNIDEMKKKAETASVFVTAFNGVIKAIRQLSIATVLMVGSMAVTGIMLVNYWDVIWKGGLMTMALLTLSLSTLALLSKFSTENISTSVNSLQDLNVYFMSLGGTAVIFTLELMALGSLWQNNEPLILKGSGALVKGLLMGAVVFSLAHALLSSKFMNDIDQTIDKLYSLQLVTIALTATAFFNSFLLYQYANYISGKEEQILYGFAATSLLLVSTMGIAIVLGKMFKNNKDDIFDAILSLAAMGLLLIEYKWISESLLDLGLMIEGHEAELLKAGLTVGSLMLGMIGIVALASTAVKFIGISNMLVGMLAIGLSAGIVHYMTFVTKEILNVSNDIKDVNKSDLLLTVGLMFGSVIGMLTVITAAGAIALFAWPAMLAGAAAIVFTSLLTYGIVKLVDSIVDLSIKMDSNKEKIKNAGPLFKDVMGLIGLMWKSLITMGDPDEEKQPVSSFISKIPIYGSLFKTATTMIEGVGVAAMLGTMNVAVNLVDKILNIAERYSSEDPTIIRTSLSNMLGIVNQFIPDLMKTLQDIDAEGLDAWKSKWWDPSTWGQGSRMGVILDAVKMTSDIMQMISNAGQMKIIKGFDSEGKPIYGTMMDVDLENAAQKIANAMSIFVNALFTELSKVEMEDADNLKQIKKLFDGGMFSTGLIGMTNSFINSVHKLGQGWVEEDGQGNKTYRRIDINQLGAYGTNLGLAVSNFVTSLTIGMVEAGDLVNNNKRKLRTFKELMMGKNIMKDGLLGTTNFLFKFIDKFMVDGTVVDENGRIVHKSGMSINDMPMYGTLLGTSVSNFISNITSALIKIGEEFDDMKLKRLFKFRDLLLGGKMFKTGLFSIINRLVSVSESIKKGEDYYDENGKLHKGSGYPIERLPEVSAIIGRSFGAFIENFKYGIDRVIIDENLLEKSEKAAKLLIGDNKLFGGNKGLLGVLDKLVKGLMKANINNMDTSAVTRTIDNTRMFFNLTLGMTRDIQKELQSLGFFTRDNINEKALKNYEKYLITLSRIMTSNDIKRLSSAMSKVTSKIDDTMQSVNKTETPKIAQALAKMNYEIIGRHSDRQRALKELTDSLQKVGDQFERINSNADIPAISGGNKNTGNVSIKQDGKEISLSKETLNTLLSAIADLKTDASATLSSRNIIVELNGGGEFEGRLMYGDPE